MKQGAKHRPASRSGTAGNAETGRAARLTALLLVLLAAAYMVANLSKPVATAVYWQMVLAERPMARAEVRGREFALPTSGLEDARGREVYFVPVDKALVSALAGAGPSAVATDAYDAVQGMDTGPGWVSTWGSQARVVFLVDNGLESMVTILKEIRDKGN